MYIRPTRPGGRHHDDAQDEDAFADALIEAIDTDPRVRAAILRLFAAERTKRSTASTRRRER